MKPVIALVGGVASGKSAVAAAFAKRGALVIDADAEGHAVLLLPEVKAEIRRAFGAAVFSGDEIDRKKMAAEVFDKPEKLATLTAITHPRIRLQTQAKLDAGLKDPRTKAIVLDISLLLESRAYEGKYSLLVFIDASQDSREARAIHARGWQKGELARRQANQSGLDQKKAQADVVIDNNGTLQDLERQVDAIWQKHVQSQAAGGH